MKYDDRRNEMTLHWVLCLAGPSIPQQIDSFIALRPLEEEKQVYFIFSFFFSLENFVSQMIQAVANYRQGSTGQLSALTIFMLTGGAAARIFTSIQETGDPMMILTYVVSTAVNLIIAGQVVYYWNSGKSAKAGGAGKKKAAAKAKKDK